MPLFLKKTKGPTYTDCAGCNKQVKATLKNCSISGSGTIKVGGYCYDCRREYHIVITSESTTIRYAVT